MNSYASVDGSRAPATSRSSHVAARGARLRRRGRGRLLLRDPSHVAPAAAPARTRRCSPSRPGSTSSFRPPTASTPPLKSRVLDGTVPSASSTVRWAACSIARFCRAVRASVCRRVCRGRGVRHAGRVSLAGPRRVGRVLTNDGVLPLRLTSPRSRSSVPPRTNLGSCRATPLSGSRRDHVRERRLVASDEWGWVVQAGPYYTEHITPLAALRSTYGDRVVHERGCEGTGDDESEIASAESAATSASVAVPVRGRGVGAPTALDGRRGA